MIAYLIRRLLYALPILLGVNLITFALFFMVNTPDDMARIHLGAKQTTAEMIQAWKAARGYDKPLFYNPAADGVAALTDTLFVQESLKLFTFDFGLSDSGRDIVADIRQRMGPSLALAVPTFLLGLWVNITLALAVVLFRYTAVDRMALVAAVVMMSISGLFYIIGGQVLFSKVLHWVPISGYQPGVEAWKFLILPVLIGVVSGIGSGLRWYRTLFLEEVNKDYVRTARAKGLSEWRTLGRHVLRNGLLPILTGVVVVIPTLFMGSLVMESFFGIPGLGSYTIEAIQGQDFAIVKAMVFLGAVLYIIGLLLTDIAYAWADPRVRFQ
ncbi:MAG TPA: ABC transporter permease [Piscirickettsiaceae bacterium]|nr:ABC transporter permease [Piscirickettsiaceae bacterium]HIQ40680.1 ABC transporter permease [Sulfurivirga caldicuralii]